MRKMTTLAGWVVSIVAMGSESVQLETCSKRAKSNRYLFDLAQGSVVRRMPLPESTRLAGLPVVLVSQLVVQGELLSVEVDASFRVSANTTASHLWRGAA